MEMVKTETRDRERRGFVNLLVAENDSLLFIVFSWAIVHLVRFNYKNLHLESLYL